MSVMYKLRKTPKYISFFSLTIVLVLFSLIISFLLSLINQSVGVVSFLIFLFCALIFLKKNGVANNQLDFIDVENKVIYVVGKGFFNFEHKKIHFTQIKKLILFTGYGGLRRYRIRIFKILVRIDEKEILILSTRSRRFFNRIAQEFVKKVNTEIVYTKEEDIIDGTIFDEKPLYSFENTLYDYNDTPKGYMVVTIGSLILSFIPLLEIDNMPISFVLIFFFLMLISPLASLKQYYGAKIQLLKIKQSKEQSISLG